MKNITGLGHLVSSENFFTKEHSMFQRQTYTKSQTRPAEQEFRNNENFGSKDFNIKFY